MERRSTRFRITVRGNAGGSAAAATVTQRLIQASHFHTVFLEINRPSGNAPLCWETPKGPDELLVLHMEIAGLPSGVPRRHAQLGTKSSTMPAGQLCLTWRSVRRKCKNHMGFLFSGHETFPCRYAWLPKAFAEIQASPSALRDDKTAMVSLGLGKNMVRSLRFWLQASGVAVGHRNGLFETTDFGTAILGKHGTDPFLEDQRTLWLLHWQIATRSDKPLFAWELLFNRWVQSEFSRSAVLHAFRNAAAEEKKLSDVTLEQHFDVFIHSYVPTKGHKGEVLEDNLDCPLVELGLIQKVGERAVDDNGHREAIYGFRLEDKAGVTPELFVFCLDDFWRKRRTQERTVTLRDVALASGSPGQIFKLPEPAVRDRLERIELDSGGFFTYRKSTSTQQVSRATNQQWSLLSRVFGCDESHA